MPQTKPTNPFYVAALPMGVLFALTACAYVVMMVRTIGPGAEEATGLVQLMERHGILVMVAELVALGLLTVAAIASDDFWTRRFEEKQGRMNSVEESP
jgi:hypothetical protein